MTYISLKQKLKFEHSNSICEQTLQAKFKGCIDLIEKSNSCDSLFSQNLKLQALFMVIIRQCPRIYIPTLTLLSVSVFSSW